MRVAAESLVSPAIELDEADRRHQLDTVRTEARRLDRLVANLLDLSRLESGAAAPRRELVAADELVAQALGELPAAEQARIVVGLPRTCRSWRWMRFRSSELLSICSRTRFDIRGPAPT